MKVDTLEGSSLEQISLNFDIPSSSRRNTEI